MNYDFSVTNIHRVIMVDREEYNEDVTVFGPGRVRHNELIYHISGVAKVFFNGKELLTKPGTIRFLPAGELREYRVERSEYGDCIDVFFDTDKPIANEAFVLDMSKRESIEPLFKKLFCSFVAKGEGYIFECKSLLYRILCELERTSYIPERRFNLIKPALEMIRSDFLSRDIRIGELAEVSGISETYLKKIFRERFGVPPKKYIIQLRINHAADLLRFESFSVTQVATLSGFSDVSFFTRQFKAYMGIAPSSFVKKYRSSK